MTVLRLGLGRWDSEAVKWRRSGRGKEKLDNDGVVCCKCSVRCHGWSVDQRERLERIMSRLKLPFYRIIINKVLLALEKK